MPDHDYNEFMFNYAPPDRPIIFVSPHGVRLEKNGEVVFQLGSEFFANESELTPFIVCDDSSGRTMVLNPILGFTKPSDHFCIDAHAFIDGEDATIGAMGMSQDFPRVSFPSNKPSHDGKGQPLSHGWPARHLVALLLGEQGTEPEFEVEP